MDSYVAACVYLHISIGRRGYYKILYILFAIKNANLSTRIINKEAKTRI